MLIVGLALAPLALASIVQAVLNYRAYQRETDRILMQTALYAAYSEQNTFARAEQILRSLARRPALTTEKPDCFAALSDALVGAMPIVNFTRVDAKGAVICMGAVAPPKPAFAKLFWWPALRKANRVVIGNQFTSPILRRPLLPIAIPLHSHDGTFAGAISASVDLKWLETAPQVTKLPEGAVSFILDANGRVLASNRDGTGELAATVAAHVRNADERVFTIDTDAGQHWRWVAERIGNSDKYVAFGIPAPSVFGTFIGYLMADVVLTILIVLATCVAIWLGAEWLVVRWTIYLKRVAVAYGRNHFGMSLRDLRTAPVEFQRLGRQMKHMAFAIQERDRNLSRALERQFVMTREIHHRVKNNLQIVSSLITLYARNVSNPPARSAFRQMSARVDALTLIQRLIEKSDTEPTIDMEVLFAQLAEQVLTLASEAGQLLDLSLDVSVRWLPPDVATPLVLLVIEVLTLDIFLPRAEGRQRSARLRFSRHGNEYLLTIEDDCPAALPSGAALSDRVLHSLVEQLQGEISVESLPNGGARLVLRVPVDNTEPLADRDKEPGENVYAFDAARIRQA